MMNGTVAYQRHPEGNTVPSLPDPAIWDVLDAWYYWERAGCRTHRLPTGNPSPEFDRGHVDVGRIKNL
jgi:hypothetical protein